jgi:hypothetical protein
MIVPSPTTKEAQKVFTPFGCTHEWYGDFFYGFLDLNVYTRLKLTEFEGCQLELFSDCKKKSSLHLLLCLYIISQIIYLMSLLIEVEWVGKTHLITLTKGTTRACLSGTENSLRLTDTIDSVVCC